jgi:hypothetical protein
VFTGAKYAFCIYDAPDPEAMPKAAHLDQLPVGDITPVRVLDPYFYPLGFRVPLHDRRQPADLRRVYVGELDARFIEGHAFDLHGVAPDNPAPRPDGMLVGWAHLALEGESDLHRGV